MLIGERIESPSENATWQLILKLRELVSLICAPAISAGQVAYLKVLIDDYLYSRNQEYPDKPLKPKHHFLSHYPELIIRFGPLIRLWTLRFESKHSYFKQCARKLHNFKNLPQTLSERHQLLQAYLHAGNLFPSDIQVEKAVDYLPTEVDQRIRDCVADFEFSPGKTMIASQATVKGTKYKKNMLVLTGESADGYTIGKIVALVIHNNNSVYFVTEKCMAVPLHDIGVYTFRSLQGYNCVNQEDLLDYYPLQQYTYSGMPVMILHHSCLAAYSDVLFGGSPGHGHPDTV